MGKVSCVERFGREGMVGKFMFVPEDVQGTIEPEPDGDFGARRG